MENPLNENLYASISDLLPEGSVMYLIALEGVLSVRYPSKRYGINVYKEDALCIEWVGDKWVVYDGERGNRYREESFSDVSKACLSVIRRITHNEEMIKEMEEEFLLSSKKEPSYILNDLIKAGLKNPMTKEEIDKFLSDIKGSYEYNVDGHLIRIDMVLADMYSYYICPVNKELIRSMIVSSDNKNLSDYGLSLFVSSRLKEELGDGFLSQNEIKTIFILTDILYRAGLQDQFEFSGLKEDCLHLDFEWNKWVLYSINRSKRQDIQKYDNLNDACEKILSLLGVEMREELISEFKQKVINMIDKDMQRSCTGCPLLFKKPECLSKPEPLIEEEDPENCPILKELLFQLDEDLKSLFESEGENT